MGCNPGGDIGSSFSEFFSGGHLFLYRMRVAIVGEGISGLSTALAIVENRSDALVYGGRSIWVIQTCDRLRYSLIDPSRRRVAMDPRAFSEWTIPNISECAN